MITGCGRDVSTSHVSLTTDTGPDVQNYLQIRAHAGVSIHTQASLLLPDDPLVAEHTERPELSS